jgi:hypothetical protein
VKPIPQPADEASPQVELPAGATVVLVVLAAVLVGIVFLLLTSGSAAA